MKFIYKCLARIVSSMFHLSLQNTYSNGAILNQAVIRNFQHRRPQKGLYFLPFIFRPLFQYLKGHYLSLLSKGQRLTNKAIRNVDHSKIDQHNTPLCPLGGPSHWKKKAQNSSPVEKNPSNCIPTSYDISTGSSFSFLSFCLSF